MAGRNYIKAIKQSVPKPTVGRPGVAAAYNPARGHPAVMKGPRINPVDTRIYGKKVAKDDPSEFFKSGFFDEGMV